MPLKKARKAWPGTQPLTTEDPYKALILTRKAVEECLGDILSQSMLTSEAVFASLLVGSPLFQ